MKNEWAVHRIDVKAFAEAGEEVTASDVVGQYPRLLGETAGQGAGRVLAWSVRGEMRNAEHVQPEVWLHLTAETVLPLACRRCLGPVDVPLTVDRSFRFVADESTAAAQGDQSDEDVLVLSRSFQLMALVEDELLMDLPSAPRHEICPEPVNMALADADFDAVLQPRDEPFAALQTLKLGKT